MSAPVKEIRNFKPRLGHVVKNLRFDTILFVSSCHLIPEIPVEKAEFLITMIAIKVLTPYFLQEPTKTVGIRC